MPMASTIMRAAIMTLRLLVKSPTWLHHGAHAHGGDHTKSTMDTPPMVAVGMAETQRGQNLGEKGTGWPGRPHVMTWGS